MAATGFTPIILYHSTTGSAVPSNANLSAGELALNIADMKLYCENSSGTVTLLASGDAAAGNFTTVDTTNLEVTNIKAKDGTAVLSIADSTGVTTQSTPAIISVNSSSDALRITQTGTGNALVVEDSANPDSTPFVVDASGKLVIGNTSVIEYTTGASPVLQVLGTSAATSSALFGRFSADGNGAPLIFLKSRGALGAQGVVISGDIVANMQMWASDGTSNIQAASIQAAVDGTPGPNDMPGRLVFSTTADSASSPTERMRIDSAGRVGIGATPGTNTTLTITTAPTGGVNNTGVFLNYVVQSNATTSASYFSATAATAAAAFTLPTLRHFYAQQGTIGATSAVTNQYGFFAESNITGATNNYGFYSNIASGTGRWNFYAGGTAENYLGGNLKIGGTAARATTAGTNHLSIFNGTAPAGTLTNGISLYSSSGDFNFMDAAGGAYKVGYRNVPAVGTKTTSYTLQTADVGKYVQVGSGGSITIPDNTFSEGDAVSLFNNTTGDITVTCTITTAYIAGADSDVASVTLATRGICTIFFISGTVCVITGNVS